MECGSQAWVTQQIEQIKAQTPPSVTSFATVGHHLIFISSHGSPEQIQGIYAIELPETAAPGVNLTDLTQKVDPVSEGWKKSLGEIKVPREWPGSLSSLPNSHSPFLAFRFESEIKSAEKLSKEEELLRERQRNLSVGISSFVLSSDSKLILVSLGPHFFLGKTEEIHSESPALLRKITCDVPGARMDPKISPDSKSVSFIREGDIWILNLENLQETRLTFASSRGKTAGVAEYIIQEEFDRYTGYWWSPDSKRILYLEVDESNVPELLLSSFSLIPDSKPNVEKYRFPRPGEPNAKSAVKIVDISDLGKLATLELNQDLFQEFIESFEYISRCGWLSDSRLWIQLLDRDQQVSRLVQLDISQHFASTRASRSVNVLEEKSSSWINVTNNLEALNDERIIHTKEETGYRHLYISDFNSGSSVQLTRGEWQVMNASIWVDQEHQTVFFLANSGSFLEQHLCCIDFRGENFRVLTPSGYHHKAFVFLKRGLVVLEVSNIHLVNSWLVCSISFSDSIQLHSQFRIPIHRVDAVDSTPLPSPVLFSFSHSELEFFACLFCPADFDERKRHKTMVFVYGGPHVQLVTNQYSLRLNSRIQAMVTAGFLVAIVDGRGSWNRGLGFESSILKKMGSVEVQDQVELVGHLVKVGICDPSHVGIHGWSYGGYMSLMCLAQRPDIFRVCISGAPVTSWEFYDTGYTERYMKTPQSNPEGYKTSSVLNFLDNFPDEENRCVIVHGLRDENVHFEHTASLIEHLVLTGKPYLLKVFPSERHGLRKLGANKYFLQFLINHLRNFL